MNKRAQGYLAENFLNVFISLFKTIKLFLKSESPILFKLNKLMVAIGKNPGPGIQFEKFYLQVVACKMSLCQIKYI